MNTSKSEVNKIENEREGAKSRYKKTMRKQDVVRPSSILSNTSTRTTVKTQAIRENSRYHSRSGSISRTSFLSERNVVDRGDGGRDLTLHGSPAPRKTHRANSLPATSCSRRYSFEAKTKVTAKKSGQARRQERREIECRSAECIFHQRMSLDLSQLSDFADSEGESRDVVRQSTKRTESRRRRSVEKTNRIDRVSGAQVRSTSNSPGSKVSSSCSHQLTRRSSLQSFSPRALSFASSFDSPSRLNGTYSIRNQDGHRRTSSATTLRKSSLGSSLSRHSELLFSSNSPDYTSDASTCEFSPCKLSPNGVSMVPMTQKVKHDSTMSNIASNRATISPNSQIPCISSSSSCHTSWVESEHTYQGDNGSMDGNVSENTPIKEQGEWDNFWQNYNSSLAAFPKKFFYDDCPTPFYEADGNIDMKAFEIDPAKVETSKKINDKGKSVEGSKPKVVERKNVMLSRTETKEMIHCAHRLAEILTLVLERNTTQFSKESAEMTAKKAAGRDAMKNGAKQGVVEEEQAAVKTVDKRMPVLAEKKEEVKVDTKGERKKQELKDITVIRGDSKDVLL